MTTRAMTRKRDVNRGTGEEKEGQGPHYAQHLQWEPSRFWGRHSSYSENNEETLTMLTNPSIGSYYCYSRYQVHLQKNYLQNLGEKSKDSR